MAVETTQHEFTPRKNVFPWFSWSAIFGGLASGMATFILLALLGVAAGITAIDPQAAEPVGNVPIVAGIWTGISMLLSAFVGGYVAARLSGLSRRSDGLLHGFVVWGVNTLFFVFLVTTSVGSLLGGVFNVAGQSIRGIAGAAGQMGEPGQSPIQALLGGANVDPQSLSALQERISAGDRQGAIGVMVNQMGMESERANTIADQAIRAQQAIPPGEDVASAAVSGLTRASWWLFAGTLFSMILGVVGGYVGAKAVGKRRHILAH